MFIKDKIINNLIKNGNKRTCEKHLFKAIKIMQKETKKSHRDIINLAIKNSTIIIKLKEIRRKKRKTKRYFSYVLTKKKRINNSIKDVVKSIPKKIPLKKSLKNEFISLSKNNYTLKNKIKSTHDLAIQKKKFSFFRWFF